MPNHFEFFNLPVQFAIDGNLLDNAYREIQNLVHPDRFVTATEAEKRTAMQWATMANDAYQILKNPLRRSAYLCELNGYDVQKETHVSMEPAFLMQQMEWRESLENAKATKNGALLEKLDQKQQNLRREQLQMIENLLNRRQFQTAIPEIRKMMFLEKFGEEIRQAFDELDSTN
ncbi:Fe-S protein assembly co-chaperone HscB [Oxalobacter paraformigenes]|uniref:Co-chaperone protein HscB homolog n=1 Tax=Oxalobacter paraformigenes TaxID=556268 RepID=C3X6S0_9BURK|nr:Fe-S protein assembly co-chaperone HscB [Oxalobacter paraformigenes]EEO28906.1 Fe-S protein assembly co-chaperone HscB [Oxalobacter paraformigenes]